MRPWPAPEPPEGSPEWGPSMSSPPCVSEPSTTPSSRALDGPATALDAAAAELGPGGDLAPERDAEAYRRRMARRREVQQQRVGERNVEKGLVLVFTGDGKGKTTAALGLVLRTLGHGEQVAVVQAAWQRSCTYLADGARKLVVLDEVNVALKLGYLAVEQVLEGLALRPPLTHVALTGRGAPPALLERADLVTEMKLLRHPFREQGVKAQAGIEF